MHRSRTGKGSRIAYFTLTMALVLVVCAACSGGDSSEPSKPTATPAPANVTVLLGLIPQVQYVGIHVAEGKGYYQNENLTVDLLYSELGSDVAAAIGAGQAQFGLTSASEVLSARGQGSPLVAVMTLYQRDPRAVISLKAKGITKPSDLVGKKILLWNEDPTFGLFAHAVGIDPAQVTLVYPEGDEILQAVAPFLTGEVDAMMAPGTEVLVQLTALGIETNMIFFDDYGVLNYQNVLVTTEQMIQEQPDVVQRLVRATLHGLEYTLDDPQAAADWFVEAYHDQLLPQQIASQDETLLALLPLIRPVGSRPGMMEAGTWQSVHDGLVEVGLLDPSVDPATAYTLQFVEAYYNSP